MTISVEKFFEFQVLETRFQQIIEYVVELPSCSKMIELTHALMVELIAKIRVKGIDFSCRNSSEVEVLA